MTKTNRPIPRCRHKLTVITTWIIVLSMLVFFSLYQRYQTLCKTLECFKRSYLDKNTENNCNADNICLNMKNSNILEGKWIKQFPALALMIKTYESMETFPTFEQSTSPQYTYVEAVAKEYKQGGFLAAKIHARDHKGRDKNYGGDFFSAILYRDKSAKGDKISCEIMDYSNGTYGVRCKLIWPGSAFLRIVLLDSSEAIYLQIYSTNKYWEPYVLKNTSFINSQGEEEYGICDMDLSAVYKESEICDHSNPRNGEPWFCTKLESGDCPPIHSQLKSTRDFENYKGIGNLIYYPNTKRDIPIRGSMLDIEIKETKENLSSQKAPRCTRNESLKLLSDPDSPTGWLLDGVWQSFLCKTMTYERETMRTCLRNKTLYFMGDSTIFQLMRYLQEDITKTRAVRGALEWPKSRTTSIPTLNLTLKYRTHGPPIHVQGPPTSRPYISDSINEIVEGGHETSIFFVVGVHMTRYHPDVLLRRYLGIKISIEQLQLRLPDITVYVIGLHSNIGCGWISYRQEVLLRSVFTDMQNVIFLPFWDMLNILNNKLAHPPLKTLHHVYGVMQSYVCD